MNVSFGNILLLSIPLSVCLSLSLSVFLTLSLQVKVLIAIYFFRINFLNVFDLGPLHFRISWNNRVSQVKPMKKEEKKARHKCKWDWWISFWCNRNFICSQVCASYWVQLLFFNRLCSVLCHCQAACVLLQEAAAASLGEKQTKTNQQ